MVYLGDFLDKTTTDEFIVSSEKKPCWHCGDLTQFIEINFEAPLCPGKCTEAKTEEFFEALRKSNPT